MNKEKAKQLKDIALRSIKIIDMLLKGYRGYEITKELGCDRRLVSYYKKCLERADEKDTT